MEKIHLTLKEPFEAKVSLVAKKTLNGNIIVYDHPEVNIIFSRDENNIVVKPKKNYSDRVYNVQFKYLNFLANKGVVDPKTIKAGSIFYALEAEMEKPKEVSVDLMEIFLYQTAKFLKSEEPYYNAVEYYDSEVDKMFDEPNEDNSTELGEVPHEIDRAIDHMGQVGRGRYMTTLFEKLKK